MQNGGWSACEEGYEGPMCSQCVGSGSFWSPAYYTDPLDYCVPCGDTTLSWLAAFMFFGFVFGFCWSCNAMLGEAAKALDQINDVMESYEDMMNEKMEEMEEQALEGLDGDGEEDDIEEKPQKKKKPKGKKVQCACARTLSHARTRHRPPAYPPTCTRPLSY